MGQANPTSVVDFRHPNYWACDRQLDEVAQDLRGRPALQDALPETVHASRGPRRLRFPSADERRSRHSPRAPVNEIKNAIFQRLRDVVRRGGSDAYQAAVAGQNGGVDRRGSTMNAFIGMKVISDLLVHGQGRRLCGQHGGDRPDA